MGSVLNIVQISDCHVSADPCQTYRGINPHQNLQALMQKVRELKPDLLLATGDLSEDGSAESYRLLKQYLYLPATPVLVLPGNHDDPVALNSAFPGSPVDSIAVSEHGPWQIIRLNSCVPGKPEGHLADVALTELETLLSTDQQRPRLISVHHQPIPVANPWIDKYPLDNPGRLLQLIDETAGVKIVLWGHIHHSFATELGGTAMLGSPSSAINSLTAVKRFTADPAGPACRWLQLNSDHTFLTGITPT
jgi:Icc protein